MGLEKNWLLVLKILISAVIQECLYKSHTRVSPYHIETSPLICRASQWTSFYMIGGPLSWKSFKCCSLYLRKILQIHTKLAYTLKETGVRMQLKKLNYYYFQNPSYKKKQQFNWLIKFNTIVKIEKLQTFSRSTTMIFI